MPSTTQLEQTNQSGVPQQQDPPAVPRITTGNPFYFGMSLFFWLVMVIGFSDNWLFDIE